MQKQHETQKPGSTEKEDKVITEAKLPLAIACMKINICGKYNKSHEGQDFS